ncbi:unnamed protein product [Notodromas monacha]|uniref:BTB domain-containing protein n=1 Tax=Notodromas monacha TaxID=399045 RepID=A0A7R9GBX5_9CRUS|nr:unnamed protein product [Notodromas monacha]CAG0916864.1 unnamed protein product [Notodromas monacha]
MQSFPGKMAGNASRIESELWSLRNANELTDMDIAVAKGTFFSVHSLIMCARSKFFRALASKCTNRRIVFVLDCSEESVYGLIKFMYTGEVEVEPTFLDEFLTLARKLEVSGLVSESEMTPVVDIKPSVKSYEVSSHGMQTRKRSAIFATETSVSSAKYSRKYPLTTAGISADLRSPSNSFVSEQVNSIVEQKFNPINAPLSQDSYPGKWLRDSSNGLEISNLQTGTVRSPNLMGPSGRKKRTRHIGKIPKSVIIEFVQYLVDNYDECKAILDAHPRYLSGFQEIIKQMRYASPELRKTLPLVRAHNFMGRLGTQYRKIVRGLQSGESPENDAAQPLLDGSRELFDVWAEYDRMYNCNPDAMEVEDSSAWHYDSVDPSLEPVEDFQAYPDENVTFEDQEDGDAEYYPEEHDPVEEVSGNEPTDVKAVNMFLNAINQEQRSVYPSESLTSQLRKKRTRKIGKVPKPVIEEFVQYLVDNHRECHEILRRSLRSKDGYEEIVREMKSASSELRCTLGMVSVLSVLKRVRGEYRRILADPSFGKSDVGPPTLEGSARLFRLWGDYEELYKSFWSDRSDDSSALSFCEPSFVGEAGDSNDDYAENDAENSILGDEDP